MSATQVELPLLGFARALRSAGVAVTQDRSQVFLTAVSRVGVGDVHRVYWAGRATLCSCPEDLPVYDKVFWAWFADDGSALTAQRPVTPTQPKQAPLADEESAGGEGDDGEDLLVRVASSDVEVLRHRDIASLSEGERARLARQFARLGPRPPTRTSYRRRPSRRGTLDTDATLRRMLARLGEPVELRHRHRSRRDRRVVLLVDVSGSMGPYADSLLRLAHRMTRAMPTETFSVGTRVTRLTRAMRLRDADQALTAAGEVVPDWSGGTRLGEGLQAFLQRWGQRGMVRGAVVVVFSDGWERGDASLLGEQMRRLHLLAHRVVWVNPHKGSAGYQPVQVGMAAALPYVDDFVAGHSLAAFERVLEVVGDA